MQHQLSVTNISGPRPEPLALPAVRQPSDAAASGSRWAGPGRTSTATPFHRWSDGDRVLVVTNDFPPRQGGIETFVRSLCDQLPADRLVVLTATGCPATRQYDADLPFPVVRDRTSMLLPTPRVDPARRTR